MLNNDTFNIDDAIFHYTSVKVALEFILHDGKLKFSTLNNTNDPFEYKEYLFSLVVWSEPKNMAQEWSSASELLNDIIRNKTKICCFCENNLNFGNCSHNLKNVYGYLRSRMWAQYADDHRGVCFVFSKKKLLEEINKLLPKNDFVYAESVMYTDIHNRRPSLNGNKILKNNNLKVYAINYIKANYKTLFFQKNYDYKDENEYRVVLYDDEDKFTYLDIDNIILGLIIGDKFHQTYIPLITKFSKKYNISCKRLHFENDRQILLGIS